MIVWTSSHSKFSALVIPCSSRETQTVAGLDGLFEDGVTIIGLGRVFTDFGGLPGSHLIAGTYATGTFTDFDPQGWLVVGDVLRVPLVTDKTGSLVGGLRHGAKAVGGSL